MSTSQKKSRRSVLKYGAVALGGLAVGGAAGFREAQLMTPPPVIGKFQNPPPAGTTPTVIQGIDPAYPPWASVNTSGQAVGFDIDMMNAIASTAGFQIQVKPWDWSAIVTALENGDLDIVCSGMTVTAARSEVVWFSMPYFSYIHQLYTLATNTQTMQQILNSGKPISCQLGATSDLWATKLLASGDNFQKLGLDSYPLALQALLDGRAVATIMDSAFSDPYLRQNPSVASQVRLVGTIGGMSVYAIAIRPADAWLRNSINAALENLMGSTQWTDLQNKWGIA